MRVRSVSIRGAEGAGTAAMLLCLATPLAMLVSRGIAPLALTLITALLVAGLVTRPGPARLAGGLAPPSTRGLDAAAVAFLGLICVRLLTDRMGGGPDRLAMLLTFSGSLVLLLLAARVPIEIRNGSRWFGAALAGTILLAALLITVEIRSAGALKRAAGISPDLFRMNRTAVMLALLLPVLALPALRPRLALRMLAILAAAIGIFHSQSESAKLALLVVLAVLGLGLRFPRPVFRLVAGAALAGTLLMPLIAPNILAVIPHAVQEAVGYGSLTIRGEIWREFGVLFWQHPLVGQGFDASSWVAGTPAAAMLDPARRALLAWGHPHNIVLQVWFEFGLFGGLALALLLGAVLRRIGRLPDAVLPAATAIFAGAYVVSAVSHGAWQEWWWCLLGIVVLLFRAGAAQRPA